MLYTFRSCWFNIGYLERYERGTYKSGQPGNSSVEKGHKSQKGNQIGDDVGHQHHSVRCTLGGSVQRVGFFAKSTNINQENHESLLYSQPSLPFF